MSSILDMRRSPRASEPLQSSHFRSLRFCRTVRLSGVTFLFVLVVLFVFRGGICGFAAACAIPDPRYISNGRAIPSERYADQPCIVRTDDGAWLCVITTGKGAEGSGGQACLDNPVNVPSQPVFDPTQSGRPAPNRSLGEIVPPDRACSADLHRPETVHQ